MSEAIKLKNDVYLDSSGIVHNKTKLSDILTYSTNEQIVGTWTNGKKIYRRSNTINANGSNDSIPLAINNIDTVLSYKATLDQPNTDILHLPYYSPNGNNCSIFYRKSNQTIQVRTNLTGTIYYSMEYTKTTD